jgi:UDP-N-acetylmuramoylalanine--D-glutamate ligase
MIPVHSKKGQKLALFGLGGSGMATAQALVAGGADLIAFDDNPQKVEEAASQGIPTGNLGELDFSSIDALVLAPGVPLTHPKPHWSVDLANAASVPIVGDVALFADEVCVSDKNASIIAITGTNGKSTTTALISHILANAGRDMQMGGNIGKAVLTLDEPENGRTYVVECSSYQIDLAPNLAPDIGILLNLAPDHLDRHGTIENYASIKAQLVQKSATPIVGVDDPYCAAIAVEVRNQNQNLISISVKHELENGVFAKNGVIFHAVDGQVEQVATLENIATLRGVHNAQNACAAWAACHASGLSNDEIQSGLESFGGLAHRMEILGHIGAMVFVNDSKATNADAAAMALSSYDRVHWIVGGLAKEGGIETLRPYFGRIEKAYLIGEAAPEFAVTLGGDVPFEISGTLEQAVSSVRSNIGIGGNAVVLLSPACASFDQYPNFEIRGEAFRDAVANLEGFVAFGGQGE